MRKERKSRQSRVNLTQGAKRAKVALLVAAAQNVQRSLFACASNGVVNDMLRQRFSGAVYQEAVFENHTTAGINGIFLFEGKLSRQQLLQILSD
jgi:hypothetical protein